MRAYGLADERRAGPFDIVERSVQQDLELVAELFEQGKVQRVHLLRVHAALQPLGDDLGQGNDGEEGRRVPEA